MKILTELTDVFEVGALQQIQDAFSKATGLAAITVDCKGNPVTEYSNFTDYCLKVREDARCLECCYRSDAHGGLESARSGKPSVYVCHAGLVDIAVPIMVKGNYLGAILTGQVQIPEDEMAQLPMGASAVLNQFEDRRDREEIFELKKKIKMTTFDQIKASADMLYAMANYIVEGQMFNIVQDELQKKDIALLTEIRRRNELEAALKESESKGYHWPYDPHFLFNVLNTIGRMAVLEKAEQTQEIVYTFSDMLRYGYKSSGDEVVPLGEEMAQVSRILQLQKMRLGNRLEYAVDIAPGCEETPCPQMTISSIVENVVYYGIEQYITGGKICIDVTTEAETVVIRIRNTGAGVFSVLTEKLAGGVSHSPGNDASMDIGLQKALRRIKSYTGDADSLQISESAENETETVIRLPAMKEE